MYKLDLNYKGLLLLQKILFKDKEAKKYLEKDEFAEAAKILLRNQRLDWQMLADGYSSLENQQVKEFQFDGFVIKVQYNTGRIHSALAKIDEESLNSRKCFLCSENRPVEQKAIQYKKDFLIICNPFPILHEHFTIPSIDHKPQRIRNHFNTFLSVSKDLSKYYNVFYNGQKCGASAPDHLHFQAVTKNSLPIESDIKMIKSEYGITLSEDFDLTVTGIDDTVRRFILIEGKKDRDVQYAFEKFYKVFEMISAEDEEPMFNILSVYTEKKGWKIFLFARSKHRPSFYYFEGEERILLSPAAIDFSGLCVVPVKEHFDRITKDHLIKIFREVSLGKEAFEFLKSGLERRLNE